MHRTTITICPTRQPCNFTRFFSIFSHFLMTVVTRWKNNVPSHTMQLTSLPSLPLSWIAKRGPELPEVTCKSYTSISLKFFSFFRTITRFLCEPSGLGSNSRQKAHQGRLNCTSLKSSFTFSSFFSSPFPSLCKSSLSSSSSLILFFLRHCYTSASASSPLLY